MNKSLSIVIGSCDAYKEVAELYVRFLRKYWKECDFPVYIVTECEEASAPDAIPVTSSKDFEWVDRVKKAVEMTESDYIWLTVDDLFISAPVDNNRMNEILGIIRKEGIQYYGFPIRKIRESKKHKRYKDYEHIFSIARNAVYGVYMGTCIWEKDELLRILNDGIETAWDVENYFLEKASRRTGGYYEHYVEDDGTSLTFSHMIKKGKWLIKGVKEISGSGIYIDYSIRGFVPASSTIRSIIVGTGSSVCPLWARQGVKKILTKAGFRFATKY